MVLWHYSPIKNNTYSTHRLWLITNTINNNVYLVDRLPEVDTHYYNINLFNSICSKNKRLHAITNKIVDNLDGIEQQQQDLLIEKIKELLCCNVGNNWVHLEMRAHIIFADYEKEVNINAYTGGLPT